jgi:hypothetical protein
MRFLFSQHVKENANKILTIFRPSDNLVPLFIGGLASILSIVTSVPGRLEQHSEMLSLFIGIFLFFPITMISRIFNIPSIDLSMLMGLFLISPFALFAGYDVCRIVLRERTNSTRIQLSGIFSFLIVASTILSIQFGIPAKLCFYTHQDLFQAVLDRQVLGHGGYKSIQKIGLVEIQDIIVTNSDSPGDKPRPRANDRDKDVYFVTGNTSVWSDRFSYGFIYSASNLNNIPEDLRSSYTHIYEKWYIFSRTGV